MIRNLRRSWLRLAPSLLVAACASSSGGSPETAAPATPTAGGATELAVIEVQHNNPANASAVTVLIEPQSGGVRSVLGLVEPGQTKLFSYNATPGSYTLIVQGGTSSPAFRLSNRDQASWNMQTNRVLARVKK